MRNLKATEEIGDLIVNRIADRAPKNSSQSVISKSVKPS